MILGKNFFLQWNGILLMNHSTILMMENNEENMVLFQRYIRQYSNNGENIASDIVGSD